MCAKLALFLNIRLNGTCRHGNQTDIGTELPSVFSLPRVAFMLPAFHSAEQRASDPETGLATCNPTSSAGVSGCTTPQYTQMPLSSSRHVFRNSIHAPARS